MSEQDTSNWELSKDNEFFGYAGAKTNLLVEGQDSSGIWLSLNNNSTDQTWYSWIPPEVAEAMGTMLLYAAQEWRQKHGDTDPR